jgi:hypothetical protein
VTQSAAHPELPATFADYFKLNVDDDDVLKTFGYDYQVEDCDLSRATLDASRLAEFRREIVDVFPHVSLTSEMARREFLIAPVLMEAARHTFQLLSRTSCASSWGC